MKKVNFRSLSIQLFLSFLVLATVVLSLASIVIYNRYTAQVIKETNKTSEKMLSQTAYSVGFICDWMRNYVFELYNDGYIFNNIYGKNITIEEEQNADRKMSQAVINNLMIYSIYLYNGNIKKVYSSLSTPYSFEDFFDQDILRLLKEKSIYNELSFVPRKINYEIYGKEYTENVLTLIITEIPLPDGYLEGALIVNIKESQIQNMIQSMKPDKDDDYFIIDEYGKVISHLDFHMFLKDMSSDKYITRIMDSSKTSGYITEVIDGKKSLVTYMTSPRLKWKYISITSYEKILEKTFGMRNLIFVLCLILFTIIIIISLWISRRLYSPVNKLIKKINNNVKNTVSINELEYITESFSKAVEDVNILQKKSKDNIDLIRQELLRNIIKNASSYFRDIEDKFEELNIMISPNDIMIFLLRIDDYINGLYNQNDEDGKQLIRYSLIGIVSEITSKYYVNEVVDMGDEFISVIFNMGKKEYDYLNHEEIIAKEDSIIEIINKIQISCRNRLNISVSGCIGKVANNLIELPSVYEFSKDLSNYRLAYGRESVISIRKVSSNIKEEYCYSDEIEKSILDSLKLHKYVQVEEKITKLFDDLHHMTYSDIMMSILRLLNASLKVIEIIDQSVNENSKLNYKILYKQIEEFDTLEEIKEWLLEIYRKAIEKVDDVSLNKKSYVDKINDIINAEYGNSNLTIEEIAIRINLSVNYTRVIFKELSGISLSDYINKFRYERAEELLKSTKLPIAEICKRVGVLNESYFFTSFKKYSGLTPSQFRKKH